MNRWEIVFSGALVLTLFSVFLMADKGECSSNIRQRSDGCGPHPLIALAAASRPFGSNGVGSLNDVLRAVRADPVVWPVMQNLLRRYDDCIRAADGLHYKRSDDSTVGGGVTANTGSVSSSSTSSGRVARYNNKNNGLRGGGMGRSIFVTGGFATSTDPEDITAGSDDTIIVPWLSAPI